MKTPCTRVIINYYPDGTETSEELARDELVINPKDIAALVMSGHFFEEQDLWKLGQAVVEMLKGFESTDYTPKDDVFGLYWDKLERLKWNI